MPGEREHGAQRRAQPEGSRPGRPRQSGLPAAQSCRPQGGPFCCGRETRSRPKTGSTRRAGCPESASTARSAARSPKGRGQEGRDNPGLPAALSCRPQGGLFRCGWETGLRPTTGSTRSAGCPESASTARSAARSPKGRGQEGRDNPGLPAALSCRPQGGPFSLWLGDWIETDDRFDPQRRMRGGREHGAPGFVGNLN
jgi:hypothetical protein